MSGSDTLAEQLAKKSVGLVSASDYKRTREELERDEVLGKVKADALAEAGAGGAAASEEKQKKKKKKEKKPTGLSFGDELEEEAEVSPRLGDKKMGKNQNVDTSFLRMNSRDADQAAAAKESAMRELLLHQEKAKDEKFSVSYIYRSEVTQREIPNGVHRGSVEVKRGMTSEDVCKVVREDVHLLGGVHAIPSIAGIRQERDHCLIANAPKLDTSIGAFLVPPSNTIFELCTKKWVEGESMFDNTLPSGIVVTERRWYEAKKHTYPYITWRHFEMKKPYSYKEIIANRDGDKGGVDVPTHRDYTKNKASK